MIWGNHRVRGGDLSPAATAWRHDVTWGASTTPSGEPITWGTTADGDLWGAGSDAEAIAFEPVDVAFDAAAEQHDNPVLELRAPAGVRRAIAAIIPDDKRRLRRALVAERSA